MVTTINIDIKNSVGKFLKRQSITPTADNTANTADEIKAVLETVATAFLLYPQAALTIILNAKNSLQQIVQADLAVLEFMLSAINDLNNVDVPINDSSDLIEAQTALIELDRLGRVNSSIQAFVHYQTAINRFLDKQLAPTIKRNGTKTFERTGAEANQDLFNILSQFVATHQVMISLLKSLHNSVEDFRSVNLTNIVSSTTISRVRSSLTKIKTRIDSNSISKTTTAIELLSGAASLASISNTTDIFNPVIQTGILPNDTSLVVLAEDVKATVVSTAGPWTIGSSTWRFIGTIDPLSSSPKPFNFQIPGPGASARAYISSESLTPVLSIPTTSKLYLNFNGVSSIEFEIPLTTGGSVAITTLVSDINTALGVNGSCIINPGTNGFLIFGAPSIISITVRSSSTGITGTYNTGASAHAILGFVSGQTSLPIGQFNSETLAASIRHQLPGGSVNVEGDRVRITSTLSDSTRSSLFFNDIGTNAVQDSFGFSGNIEPIPSFLEIFDQNTSVIQDPANVGVYVGSILTTEESPAVHGSTVRILNNEPVIDIQGTRLFFNPNVLLPRRTTNITMTSTIVSTVQEFIRDLNKYTNLFDGDISAIQRILSPLISKPAESQLKDAKRVLQDVRNRIQTLLALLTSVIVRSDHSQFYSIAVQILSSLEERGLDRAHELLSSGQFSLFFSLDNTNSSKSNRLLTAIETVARQDLPVSTLEVDIDDDQTPRGVNPNSAILSGAELENAGPLVTNI